MRTLMQIVTAVRSQTGYSQAELEQAVVAFDVLIAHLKLHRDVARQSTVSAVYGQDVSRYITDNQPRDEAQIEWFDAMHTMIDELEAEYQADGV